MLISNNNYARNSDFVFAETVDHITYETLESENLFITDKSKDGVAYKSKILKIADGDSIFSRTDYLDELFFHIKKTNKKNLKLITHQTDIEINDAFVEKLPNNFTYWFGINKNTDSDKVVSLPIGIAGDFSYKNLQVDDFSDSNIQNFDLKSKKLMIYLNFQKNTNNYEREKALQALKHSDKVYISEPNLEKMKYKHDLERFVFVLCPWGNGFDTHRIWETLYSGSIPVIKKHKTFEYLEDLPALFIDNYEDLLDIELNKFVNDFDIANFNLKKLNIEYWVNQFKNTDLEPKRETIYINYYLSMFFYFKLKINDKFSSYKKKANYYFKKIKTRVTN